MALWDHVADRETGFARLGERPAERRRARELPAFLRKKPDSPAPPMMINLPFWIRGRPMNWIACDMSWRRTCCGAPKVARGN
ncbi:MAG: hypothetical protein JWR49_1828 [Tardiphaga sp.]|nr:hypothetical protein [Tardiphaga sp.]